MGCEFKKYSYSGGDRCNLLQYLGVGCEVVIDKSEVYNNLSHCLSKRDRQEKNNPPKCNCENHEVLLSLLLTETENKGQYWVNKKQIYLKSKAVYEGGTQEGFYKNLDELEDPVATYIEDVLRKTPDRKLGKLTINSNNYCIMNRDSLSYIKNKLEIGDQEILTQEYDDKDVDAYNDILLEIMQQEYQEIEGIELGIYSLSSMHQNLFPYVNRNRR